MFHVTWQENFESSLKDPLHGMPTAHTIWDPHFGNSNLEMLE